jgi:hypothetical protein
MDEGVRQAERPAVMSADLEHRVDELKALLAS